MIVEIIRYQIDGEQHAEFEQAYREAQRYLAKSQHCLEYELVRCVKIPNRYFLSIRWESADGHLKGFRRSSAFVEFAALVKPYFEQIDEMEHYEPTGINWSRAM